MKISSRETLVVVKDRTVTPAARSSLRMSASSVSSAMDSSE
jgi:hypothetical protein